MAARNYMLMYFLLCMRLQFSWGRNHTLTLADDSRKSFGLSTFGLLKDGRLCVSIKSFSYSEEAIQAKNKNPVFGFSLEKTSSDGIASYMDASAQQCVIRDALLYPKKYAQYSLVLFEFKLQEKPPRIVARRRGKDFSNLQISTVDNDVSRSKHSKTSSASHQEKTSLEETASHQKQKSPATTTNHEEKTNPEETGPAATTNHEEKTSPGGTASRQLKKSPAATKNNEEKTSPGETANRQLKRSPAATTSPKTTTTGPGRGKRDVDATPSPAPDINILLKKQNDIYIGKFEVLVKKEEEEGLYNLYFHNCHNYELLPQVMKINMEVNIVEVNANNNYLSAGEEPLPVLFGMMGVMFLIAAFFWTHILRKNREKTFKIHYMMLLLIIIKSLDLIFNALNFHFISRDGKPAEPWPVLYYIIHLMKGALLFTTIVLIGTGYFFIKHVLSDRDKKIFLIVIPLQVIANAAQIVMDSTEKGQKQYATWKEIFILVDLLCCGAILFPVIWSIRHLQEASQTDGKAAMNLAKLKLFRHYYIMIVCYIYFTRIIVYLLRITVPFQYEWLDEFFMNLATFVFFVVTGYKFQPASNNPYLRVPEGDDEDEELEMDEIITSSGATDGVTRVNHNRSKEDSHAV